jgi:uncharacterized membrane protein
MNYVIADSVFPPVTRKGAAEARRSASSVESRYRCKRRLTMDGRLHCGCLLMAAVGVTMMMVMTRKSGGPFWGPGPGGSRREQERGQDQGRSGEDPLAVLRERYARGEIGHEESGRNLDGLIRTESGQQPGHGGGRD